MSNNLIKTIVILILIILILFFCSFSNANLITNVDYETLTKIYANKDHQVLEYLTYGATNQKKAYFEFDPQKMIKSAPISIDLYKTLYDNYNVVNRPGCACISAKYEREYSVSKDFCYYGYYRR